jgi:TonB-linked SusC/RagA family outer membrane protein
MGLAIAQDKQVSGIVVDDLGDPVIGASVIAKGTNLGTATGIDGRFQFQVPDNVSTIVIKYIGYSDVSVAAGSNLRITLKPDAQLIDEVVVVGYGTQKKENLTGAVSSVDVQKTLDSRPISDVGRGLQGAVGGLSIVIPNGEIGSDPVIRIRGQIASINSTASSSPLILLDNVEIPSISLVNPDDIESISVLKDASSASIYGAKAALGVVLITTKKGAKTDKVSVSYSNNFSWAKVAKDINMATLDGLEYAVSAIERVGLTKTGAFYGLDRTSYERSKEWVSKYGNSIGPDDPTLYGRDWYWDGATKYGVRLYNSYDHMIDEWTPTQTHNLSVNGRSGRTQFNIGLGYFDQTGLLKTTKKDKFDRYNATAKVNTDINKYVSVRAGFLYSQRTKTYPYMTNSTTADPWLYVYRWGPLQAFGTDQDGHPLRSPAAEGAAANAATRQNNYMNANLGFTLNFTENWSLDGDYTYSNNEYLDNRPGTRYTAADTWSNPVLSKDADGNQIYVNNEGAVVPAGSAGAIPAYQLPYTTYTGVGANPDHIRREQENRAQHTYNMYSTYLLNLNDVNHFKFMAGLNIVESKTVNVWAQKTELLNYTNPQFDLAVGTQTNGGKTNWESQAGFFGRVNYDFAQKYLLEANLRYDGTSKFPTSLKWRYFPSFSAGWRANEETFMQWAQPTLSALKFRGSWGIIGDQTVSSTLYVPTLGYYTSTWLNGATKFTYYGTPSPVDGNITWQDFETLDFGVDARFLQNELGVTFDWFQRTTNNMIAPGITLPYAYGAAAPVGNYAELTTKGWEFALDYNHRFKNGIGVNAMITVSDAITDITGYVEGATKGTAATSYWKGKRYGDIWGYTVDRLYQKDDFEYDAQGNHIVIKVPVDPSNPNSATKDMYKLKGDNPVYQPFVESPSNFRFGPGDVMYKDLNGDGRINNGLNTADDPGDLSVIGNTTPRYQYGIRLGADYRGFDLSLFFQGVGKRSVWGDGALAIPGYNVSDGAMAQAIARDFWREDRTGAFYPRPYNIGAVAGGSTVTGNTQVSDRYLLNMAYFRLKNVTFGYSLPDNLLRKVSLTKARIYASLENIMTWDNLNGLPIDPEVINGYSMFDTSNYNSSRTGVGAPMFKNVSFGIQLTF